MRILWKKQISIVIISIIVCCIQMFTTMQVQLYKGRLLNAAIEKEIGEVWKLAQVLFIMLIISMLFTYCYSVCRIELVQKATMNLRQIFFKSVLNKTYQQQQKYSEGELIAKYTKQIGILENKYFGMITQLTEMVFKIIFVTITLIKLNWVLAGVTITVLILPIVIPRIYERRVTNAESKKIHLIEMHIKKVTAWFQGFELIKNYGIESEIIDQHNKSNKVLLQQEEHTEKVKATAVGVSFITSLGAQLIIALLSVYMVLKGRLSAGDFLSVMSLTALLNVPLYWIAKFYQEIIATRPVRHMLMEFISEVPVIKKDKDCVVIKQPPTIDYRHVTFGYDGESTLLNDISIEIQAGRKYLITGKSGSGKSTLMKLLLGYYEPLKGDIYIDGSRLKDIESAEKWITVVHQEAYLFNDTVKNNLTLYQDSINEKCTKGSRFGTISNK